METLEFDHLAARVEAELIQRHQGRQLRDEIVFPCISGFHEDRHPSAGYHTKKMVHHCFACGYGGGLKDLAARLALVDDRRPVRFKFKPQPKRHDWRGVSHLVMFASENHWLKADLIFKAARKIELGTLTDDETTDAWQCLAIGFRHMRVSERLADVALAIRAKGLAGEHQRRKDHRVAA